MNDNEKREAGMMIPFILVGVAIGAFAYFTSSEAHQRGEGLKVPTVQPGVTYCKPLYKGDNSCKL